MYWYDMIINIPIEFRHLLGEPGDHEFNIAFGGEALKFEFTSIENPDFKGFTCYFYDKDKKLINNYILDKYKLMDLNYSLLRYKIL